MWEISELIRNVQLAYYGREILDNALILTAKSTTQGFHILVEIFGSALNTLRPHWWLVPMIWYGGSVSSLFP